VEQIQIEELVAELETRVDRLRSLYEQYFMGIEKMEPHVPRKDVERRFQAMRREQIRNTALRFRFQMVLQKYNTYQSYWMRIMRQIEDGTYKRDVLRAKSNLGEKRRSTRPPPPAEKEEAPRVMSPSMVDDFIFDTGAEEGPTRKVEVPTARAQTQSKADLLLEFSPFDEATTKLMVPTGLDVDEDPTGILPLVGNAAGNHGPAAPKARPAADPEKMRQLAARIKGLKNDEPKKEPPPAPNADASGGHKPPPLPPKAGNAPAMKPPTLPGAIRPLGAPIGMKPPTLPSAIRPAPAAPPPMKPPTLPAAIKPPASPPAMKPPTPPAAKAPVAPPIPMRPPAAPAAMKPLAPPITAPTAAPIPAPAPKAANSSDLSDARVRQIYSQYVDTKRKQNESTTAITYEGVAKSLRESTARLKEKHGNNSVDFEVAVKEGKTILRPVLKKEAPKPPNKDEK
jgi:hypothetical protein